MTPGFYPLISEAQYHADRHTPEASLSSTLMRTLLRQSPRHAWTDSARLNPAHEPKVSDTFDVGKVCHAIVLGRGAAYVRVDAPNWTTKAAREERDAIRAQGLVPILAEQLDRAEAMAAELDSALRDYRINLGTMDRELPAYAQIDGVWCRAMFDAISRDRLTVYDYKTCEDASPDAAMRSVCSYGYDAQAAWYQDVARAITGETPRFAFIFQEKAPPYEVSVVDLCDDMGDEADWMQGARDDCARARRTWRRCLDTGRWPGYPRVIATLGAPAWHTAKRMDRAARPSPETLATYAKAMEP